MNENKKRNKKKFKVANLIFWIVLAIVAIYSVVAITSTDDSVTSIFGQTALTVQTDSMAPTFEAGDLIYVDTEFDANDIEIGDVITYQILIDVDGDGTRELVYNSHRVVEISPGINEKLYFGTQGDNNTSQDTGLTYEDHIVGVWNGKVTKNLGGIIDGIVGFLKSGTGFFIFIVLPCFAFLVYEVYKFVNVMADYKSQQTLESRVKLQEEAIAMAKKQLEEEAKLKALEEKK
ncbi:MAG: signal peptidase I [Tenericutes bacterium]|nr:signal peptidase I [Mycoplasmatota bacterium]